MCLPRRTNQPDYSASDCAFKDLRTSDFVVGQVHARLGSSRYLLHQVRGRKDMPGTAQAIRAMSENYPEATAKLVEDKANGPAVIQSLKHEITGLLEVNPQGGKMSRAAGVSPEVEAGRLVSSASRNRTPEPHSGYRNLSRSARLSQRQV